MGCDRRFQPGDRLHLHFNPRTRMGCDGTRASGFLSSQISIHAPAWGATRVHGHGRGQCHISIHAPAWGATPKRPTLGPPVLHFNPRTRMGCDRRQDRSSPSTSISIHAPAWGATIDFCVVASLAIISIHAPAWGATGGSSGQGRSCPYFNPRTRMGCDFMFNNSLRRQPISIHAPAWGATLAVRQSRLN